MAEKPTQTVNGVDYYTEDLSPTGAPYEDAVPVGQESSVSNGSLGSFPNFNTGMTPLHWPFIPNIGQTVTFILPTDNGNSQKELITITGVDVLQEVLDFDYSGSYPSNVLKAGRVYLSSTIWGYGFRFEL
jgi:hypothetical protein